VPPERYSSYDRGFDLGHADVPPTKSPVLGRTIEPRAPTGAPWKKVLAMAMVAIMVGAAFMMLVPLSKEPASAPDDDKQAHTQAGEREVTYTISNIGESYVKDSRDVDGARGTHGSTPGLSEWWTKRKAAYSDTIIHNSYPYSVAYNPESAQNSYSVGVTHLSFGTYSYYRLTIDAKNVTTVATGANKDPLFLPVLGNIADDGGTAQLNWHFTYLTSSDVTSMLAGTSYVNTYYGVTASVLAPLGTPSYANDGWYYEHSGLISLDRAAAKKILGLAGSADLRTDFNTSSVGGALNNSFRLHYWTEGGADAIYDTMACYDYTIATGPSNCYFLKLDPSSTQDQLVVRVWGYTWGMDGLMIRYMDVAGLNSNFIPWGEDWYFNATITSNGANIFSRMTAAYHMTLWKDSTWWGPTYELGAQHADYNDYDGPYWLSRFTPYMAYRFHVPLKTNWEPGTNSFGTDVAFWVTPRVFSLADGEKLVLKLPTQATMGYIPYKGTVSDTFPKNGGGNDAKAVEMNTHQMWGEMVLGPGTFPSSLYSASYYDAGNKTLTMVGPMTLPRNADSAPFALQNETGSPSFMLDIAKVSTYEMTFPSGTPTGPGAYTLRVTAKNINGTTVTDWNGTVNLGVTGSATLGDSTHVFVPGDNGIWQTTLTITGVGTITVTTTDSLFTLDVTDTIVITSIPEFPTLLMPVMAAAAMIVVFIRRKPKSDEE
jgi:hypothetical protein